MKDISMYYTFSTIPQVLAAFIALGGVFVIFRVQELKKMLLWQVMEINKILDNTQNPSFSNSKLKYYHACEHIEGMIEEMEHSLSEIRNKGLPQNQKRLDRLNLFYEIFMAIELVRKRLIEDTIISLIIGASTLLFSISILPLVHIIVNYLTISWLFCVIGLAGTFVCIIYMTITILKSLALKSVKKETNNK